MKKLFLILVISFSAMASNWMPVSSLESKSPQGYQLESSCPGKCIDVGDDLEAISKGFYSLENLMVDDITKPIWATRSMVESCEDEADCKARSAVKVCTDGRSSYWSEEDGEVWCNKITGYQKKESEDKSLKIDTAGLTQKKAQDKAAQDYEAAIALAIKAMDCGQRVKAVMIVRNASKNLTTTQVGQMVGTNSQIMALLDSGSLTTAKQVISTIPADGTLITEGDKTALVSEIDKCKP